MMRDWLAPPLTRPVDFDAFWNKTLADLAAVAPAIERRRIGPRAGGMLEEVRFRSLGDAPISAYLLRAPDARARPLVVHSHGYGHRCAVMDAWSRAGVDVCGVDVRGCGDSRNAVARLSPHGYVLTGIDEPERHILRGAICDFVRAGVVARQLLADEDRRIVYQGVSFAGALALMAQAIAPDADFLAVGVPSLGWAEGRRFFARRGSGKEINDYLEKRPDDVHDVMVVLSYFDPTNFAESIRSPTLLGVGLSDDVVPANTVYAIANHLTARHEIMEFPVSHSDTPEEQRWSHFEAYWLRLAREGVPTDFGGSGGRTVHRLVP